MEKPKLTTYKLRKAGSTTTIAIPRWCLSAIEAENVEYFQISVDEQSKSITDYPYGVI